MEITGRTNTPIKKYVFFALTAFLFSTAAPFSQAEDQSVLKVVNSEGDPIANATVLLGYESGNPFPGNVLKTNANGLTPLPTSWKSALPLTVSARGYIALTLPLAQPGRLEIMLTQKEQNEEIEVKGTTTDYGRLVSDGKVDFGLVIPALSREQMLAFDVSSVISPQIDTIEVIGGNKIDLPSNIALPLQRETYVFPIEFNKPDYRVYLRSPGDYRFAVAHGQFPLQRVVSDIRAGKSMFELINHFTFLEMGQRNIRVAGNLANINLPVNQIPFRSTVSVRSPNFPEDQVMVAMSLLEQDSVFVPTDLKRMTPNQNVNLKTTNTVGEQYVLSLLLEDTSQFEGENAALMSFFSPLLSLTDSLTGSTIRQRNSAQNFSRLSFAFLPGNSKGVAPRFLPLIAKPELSGQVMKMKMPALLSGLEAAATYLVLSEIEMVGSGDVKTERRTRLWELWTRSWTERVELPKIEFEKRSDRTYRWDVMFLARPNQIIDSSSSQTRVDLNTISHVTRNALDL